MDIKGFLRWQFEGSLKSMSFYGFMIAILGVVAAVAGCPKPWPFAMLIVGLALIFIDAVRSWFRFSYGIYDMERQRIERELRRKE